jgi:hypothetical protein
LSNRNEGSVAAIAVLKAIIPPDAIRDVGVYLVTVKSRGEPIAQSYPAPFVVGVAAPGTAQAPVTVP